MIFRLVGVRKLKRCKQKKRDFASDEEEKSYFVSRENEKRFRHVINKR
jgi:hypothetical protein